MTVHEIINPANEMRIQDVELFDRTRTDEAIDRAAVAFETWKHVAPAERANIMRRFAQSLDAAQEDLAQMEVANAGHVIGNARWEAGNVRDVIQYYSAAPERLLGDQIPVEGGINVTFHEPLGVVGVIVPWNFPMPIAGWAIGPALAAGNTVVLKPAELTPLTALRIGRIAQDSGIPDGVLQVLPGKGSVVGERFVTHPAVRKIVFTGSTAVGQRIMAGCAPRSKRVTLEMGGKNSNIVFADADVRAAALAAPGGAFDNAGQDCCARSRILVQDSVFDEFLEHLESAVKNFVVGDPLDESSDMGPLISAGHRDSVLEYVDQGNVAFRGSAPAGPGFWVPPTVLIADSETEKCFTEEIFGPVVSVFRFQDEAEALRIANNTEYGLSGSVWTRDLGRALRVSRGVQSGNLSVNSHSSVRYSTPFGGFKQSGFGRELGPHAVEAFTEVKNVYFSNN
ncbi:aldehyde dehydrogenase [Kocuria sp. TGY1127_2]|uniref:aldehyde dehydrogenase family protein n=1 Tax=Kocuria sp. TGY1127_2 TaxID=2711328 RepID=UPI0015C04B91|nr:aldehyde dehydrogenase family protein [Kocuria sp. TGY1127_2]